MVSRSYAIYQALLIAFIVISGSLMAGCVDGQYTCVGCHTDKDTLEKVADSIEYPEESGEG